MGLQVPVQLMEVLSVIGPLSLGGNGAFDAVEAADPVAVRNSLDSDISIASPYGNGGGGTVFRLREGIERFMVTDINNPAGSAQAQSEIVVMFDCISLTPGGDIPFNHVPGGSNVLFMDGHVEFIRFEKYGRFPVNTPFASIVEIVGHI